MVDDTDNEYEFGKKGFSWEQYDQYRPAYPPNFFDRIFDVRPLHRTPSRRYLTSCSFTGQQAASITPR